MKGTLLACILFCLPAYTSAVTYFFDPPIVNLDGDSQFTIVLKLDPDGEFINAIEGVLVFPGNLLKIVSIDQSDSVISNWIIEPISKRGEINFSGIIPGGFDGVRKPLEKGKFAGTVFSITFESRRGGNGAITLEEILSLRNDGLGSRVASDVIPLAVNVEGAEESSYKIYLTVLMLVAILTLVSIILRKRLNNDPTK